MFPSVRGLDFCPGKCCSFCMNDEVVFDALRDALRDGKSRGARLPRTGQVFGPYRLLQEIHRGGQGVVFAAVRESDAGDRNEWPGPDASASELESIPGLLAVKIMLSRTSVDRTLRRLERELALSHALRHPHFAAMLEYGVAEGFPYSVMSWACGDRLSEVAARLDLPSRLELFIRIGDAVEHAHGQGIVHRDLKPSNIVVNSAGTPKILDFGIATTVDGASSYDPRVTATDPTGTLGYSAPEQLSGGHATGVTADVYSLGVILYELVTGHLPIEPRDKLASTLVSIARQPPRDPRLGCDEVDDSLAAILYRALAKRPRGRHGSVKELSGDIRSWLDGQPLKRKSTRVLHLRDQLYLHGSKMAAGLAVLLAMVWTVWWLQREVQPVARTDGMLQRLLELHATERTAVDLSILDVFQELEAQSAFPEDPMVAARLWTRVGTTAMNFLWYESAASNMQNAADQYRLCQPAPQAALAEVITSRAEALIELRRTDFLGSLETAGMIVAELDDPLGRARLHLLKARAMREGLVGEVENADAEIAAAMAIGDLVGGEHVRALARHERALLYWRQGRDPQLVRDSFAAAAPLWNVNPAAAGLGFVRWALDHAQFEAEQGFAAEAVRLRETARQRVLLTYNSPTHHRILEELATRAIGRGDAGGSGWLLRASLALTLRGLTGTDQKTEAYQIAQAVEQDGELLPAFELLVVVWGDGAYEITNTTAIAARALFLGGDLQQARDLIDHALSEIHCRAFGTECPYRVDILETLGRIEAAQGNDLEALKSWEEALEIRRRQGWVGEIKELEARLDACLALLRTGQQDAARRRLTELEADLPEFIVLPSRDQEALDRLRAQLQDPR